MSSQPRSESESEDAYVQEDFRDEVEEETRTDDALAVVVGYVPPGKGKRTYSTLLMTVEDERKEVPARIVEIARKTKGSRLVEDTPTRLYAVGTVLEVKARHGAITSSDGELIEAEKPRKEDTETGVRILVTNEEMVAILRSMERLTDSVPVVRSGMPLFTQAEEVFGWREREEVKEAATLASALQAEVNTWLEEGDRFGVEGADEKLAERMAALHVQEMKAVVLKDSAEGHTGMLYVSRTGRPVLRQADRPPREKIQTTTGERIVRTLVVIDHLVRYEPQTDRYEAYAVLYDPLSMKTPYVLHPKALSMEGKDGRSRERATDERQILPVLGVVSVGKTREEALAMLLPAGAWIEAKIAETIDRPISEGMEPTHETKNWASTFFQTKERNDDGTTNPLKRWSMVRRVPNRTTTRPEDYARFESSSFYDVPGAYRLITMYPHDEVVEEATRGRQYQGRDTYKARMHDVKTSGLSFFRPASEITLDDVKMWRVASHNETIVLAAQDLKTYLKLPLQKLAYVYVRDAEGKVVYDENKKPVKVLDEKGKPVQELRKMVVSEFPHVYAPGHVNALVHEAAYFPGVHPLEPGESYLRKDLGDSTFFVVAAVKGSQQTKQESYVVYGALYFEEKSDAGFFETEIDRVGFNVPWVMYKPPIILDASLVGSDGAVDSSLSIDLRLGGPEITELNQALRAELDKLMAYYGNRTTLDYIGTTKTWDDSYIKPLLSRFKFKVDATRYRDALKRDLLVRNKAASIKRRLETEVLSGKEREDLEKELDVARQAEEKAEEMLKDDTKRLFVDVSHSAVMAHMKDVWESFWRHEEDKHPVFKENRQSRTAAVPDRQEKRWTQVPARIWTPGQWRGSDEAKTLFETYSWKGRQ